MIYSIGYSRFTFSQVKALMDDKEITLLVDVRSVPYSRRADKYDFNKNRLYKTLGKHYTWKGEILGGKHGPATEAGIDWLEKKHKRGCTLLIMCMEAHPQDCHRFTDIGMRLLERGINTVHIVRDESASPLVVIGTITTEDLANALKGGSYGSSSIA
jgi:uncharacterized protein (DUF488 family)